MIGLAPVYALLGGFMLFAAASNLRRTERGSNYNAAFWGLLGSITLLADWLPAPVTDTELDATPGVVASPVREPRMRALAAMAAADTIAAPMATAGNQSANSVMLPSKPQNAAL